MNEPILYRRYDTPDGPREVRINRRDCKGEWTAQDDAMMAELVNAAIATVKARDAARAATTEGGTTR